MSCAVFDDANRIFLGTHRIQRIPKTEKKNRRHTSFVHVYELKETQVRVQIKDSDLTEQFYRASGSGGQHRNKTDSAVRLIHNPTGTVVYASEQRSQHQNREVARQRMEAKLIEQASGGRQVLSENQTWDWCDWRDEVTLPNGRKKRMGMTLKKGIKV